MYRRTITKVLTILLAGSLVSLQACTQFRAYPEDAPVSSPLLSQLRELKPLPKVHYSWPLPFEKLSHELLYEYVRLTHAASLSGEWCKPEHIDRCVSICKKVNATKPKIQASIAVNYSPWHRRFGKNLPPTDTGPTHKGELAYLKTRMEMIRDQLKKSNEEHDASIAVTAILFDSERFHTRADNPEWNGAITEKYNAVYDIVRIIFPKVRVEWCARGAVQPSASETGWSEFSHFALDEKGESLGCSLYQVPEIEYTRETFRRTARKAVKHGCTRVTPWIALASGYRRTTGPDHDFSLDWNYDLIYSWQLGAEINHPWFGEPVRHQRFAPWHMAEIAIFYPEPMGRVPRWGQHFVAYVRGAHLIKSLPDNDSTNAGKQSE
ncbi:MAG: hypothetical protein JRI67_06545 [Deltaproteobacteria bacterium]|nr:hypothetical protein [Deltaproteobacteria bacterium]